MIILGILLLGYISLRKLSIDLFPEINAPRIFVELRAGERPPEEIEKQFVEGIESQAIRLKGVSQVYSTCMVGAARIKVEYNWGTDMDDAFLDLQKALSSVWPEFRYTGICHNPARSECISGNAHCHGQSGNHGYE